MKKFLYNLLLFLSELFSAFGAKLMAIAAQLKLEDESIKTNCTSNWQPFERTACDISVIVRRSLDLRQNVSLDFEKVQQIWVPIECFDIHE